MAQLTANFTANFASFQTAVDQAQVSLKDFGTGADSVGAKLNSLGNSLSGRAIIQQATEIAKAVEAVGGVANLTDAELAKIGPTIENATEKATKLGIAIPDQWKAISEAADTSSLSWEHLGETITKAFEDPIGAMKSFGSTLASSVTDELGAFGLAAVGVVSGIAALGAGIFELADKAAEAGSNLNDLSMKTGMSVPALSELSNAMAVAGGNMDQMGNASFMLSKNIAENSTKFQEGLSKIGLTTDQLKAAGPDEYLKLISAGLATTADSSQQAAAAAEIFGGRIGRDMLPVLEKLPAALQAVADIQPWTKEEAEEAEAFDMAVASIKIHIEALGTSMGRDLIPPLLAFGSWLADHGKQIAGLIVPIDELAKAATAMGSAYNYAAAAWMVWKGESTDMEGALKAVGVQTEAAAAKTKAAADVIKDAASSPAALRQAWLDANTAWTTSTNNLSVNTVDLSKDLTAQGNVMKDLGASYTAVHKESTDAATAAQKYNDAVAGYNAAGATYEQTLAAVGNTMYEGIAYDLARGASTAQLEAVYGATATQIDMVKASEKSYADQQKDTEKATEATATSMEHFEAAGVKAAQSVVTGPLTVLKTLGIQMGTIQLAADKQYGGAMNTIADGSVYAAQHMQQVNDTAIGLEKTINEGLSQALEKLPGEITKAFTSGNIGQAFEGIALSFVNTVEKPIMASLGKVSQAAVSAGSAGASALGQAVGGNTTAVIAGVASSLGGAALAASGVGIAMAGSVAGAVALGAATMGIGAAAVGVVMLIKHFTGLSQSIKDGRAAEAEFEKALGGSEQMIATVGAAYTNMGLSAAQAQNDIQALFAAENQGPAAVVVAMTKINDVLTASAQKTADVATGVDAITAATATLGGTAPTSLQPLIKSLEALPGLTDDEKKSLDGLLGSGTTDYESLIKMADTYGISLDALGPKFQQGDISAKADQIVKDFQSLTDAGADAGGVLSGMSSNVSDLVNEAIKYGSSLPTALEPIIDNLLQAGKLTDETGAKLDDVSQLKFDDTGDPLAQGIDKLTAAIENLTKTLGGLPAAADDAAKGISDGLSHIQVPTVRVPVEYDTSGAPTGSSAPPPEAHATGGYVGGGSFPGAPSGTDTTPAWLTPGELVLTREQQQQLGAQSSGGPTAITIVTPLVVDGREIARAATTYQTRDLQARRKLSAA